MSGLGGGKCALRMIGSSVGRKQSQSSVHEKTKRYNSILLHPLLRFLQKRKILKFENAKCNHEKLWRITSNKWSKRSRMREVSDETYF